MTDKEWRLEVLGGGWSCEICGVSSTGAYFHPHHYIHKSQSKELRMNIRNGVRLCRLCHDKVHQASKKDENSKLIAGKEWFANEFQRIRPGDKSVCDEILQKEREIK